MSDVTKFKHGEEGTHFACAEMANSDGETRCCACTNHSCMKNTKPQQECKCRKEQGFEYRHVDCPIHGAKQQDTELEEWAGENPYANGKQQDTGWEERFDEEVKQGRFDVGTMKSFIGIEKAISEHQGYQRGLQEIEKNVRRIVSSHREHEGKEPIRRELAEYFIELRKKLAEKVNE